MQKSWSRQAASPHISNRRYKTWVGHSDTAMWIHVGKPYPNPFHPTQEPRHSNRYPDPFPPTNGRFHPPTSQRRSCLNPLTQLGCSCLEPRGCRATAGAARLTCPFPTRYARYVNEANADDLVRSLPRRAVDLKNTTWQIRGGARYRPHSPVNSQNKGPVTTCEFLVTHLPPPFLLERKVRADSDRYHSRGSRCKDESLFVKLALLRAPS